MTTKRFSPGVVRDLKGALAALRAELARGSAPPGHRPRAAASRAGPVRTATPSVPSPDLLELFKQGREPYVIVPRGAVDDAARRAAERMADACAAELGLRRPAVRFVAARGDPGWLEARSAARPDVIAGPRDCLGFYTIAAPDAIHVRTTASPEQAAWIAAHELRHYGQHRANGAAMRSADIHAREELERDADAFAERMLTQVDI